MSPSPSIERRATPPRPPTLPSEHQEKSETIPTNHTTRGLLWLGLAILLAAIARAGLHRVFLPHWWRQW